MDSEKVKILLLSNSPSKTPDLHRKNIWWFGLILVGVVASLSLYLTNAFGSQESGIKMQQQVSKAVAPPTVITSFKTLKTNDLGFYQDTDGTMPTYALVPGGVRMIANAASYWYSMLVAGDTSTCFSTTATYLRISVKGLNAVNGRLNIGLAYSTSATGCLRSKVATFTITQWRIDPVTGNEIGEVPLSSFVGLTPNKLRDIAINAPIFPAGR